MAIALAQHARTALVFLGAVAVMSLRPVLLHNAQKASGGLDSRHFLLGSELLKIAFCTAGLCYRHATLGPDAARLWLGLRHTAAFAPPAVTYLVMNGFFVYGNKIVSPARWQLLGNMKIMTTAVIGWLVMSQPLQPLQWLALGLLSGSTCLGQWAGEEGVGDETPLLGFCINMLCCVLSGLGAVLTERLLKSSASKDLSIFATNVHMAIHTVIFNTGALMLSTSSLGGALPEIIVQLPVLLALGNEALSGILLSQIMRFADSNVKNYAFSVSVFTTIGFSSLLFNYWPRLGFYVGALLVLFSLALYMQGKVAVVRQEQQTRKEA